MRILHDNFWSLQANAGELVLVVRNDKGWKFVVLRNNRSGWHVIKHISGLTSIEEKNRVGSRNPVTTKMEI